MLEGIGAVLSGGWKMLVETDIPGLGFSFAALLVGVTLLNFGFTFLSNILGFGFGGVGLVGYFTSGDASAKASYRKQRNTNAKISAARKNDAK